MAENITNMALTDGTFERAVLESSEPVLVDFWAPWCGPCRMTAPVIDELATEFAGHAKVGKVNVDDHPRLAAQYGIRAIPTLLFFKDGRVVDRLVGVVPKRVLADKLHELMQLVEGA
ncbi:MAG: thioredoxin [Candidatus Rokubacteria bacterium]|nr:thioredoxin [Candidatus Rokubacteria bacterium]